MRHISLSDDELFVINYILDKTSSNPNIDCIYILSYHIEETDSDSIELFIVCSKEIDNDTRNFIDNFNNNNKRLRINITNSIDYNIDIETYDQFILEITLGYSTIIFDKNNKFDFKKIQSLSIIPVCNNINN